MPNEETVLVTGAGGFIGGWLAETLFLSGSSTVRAGIRRWSSAARLARFPLSIVLCDVMDKKRITDAMKGATCVIHCAYGSSEVTVLGTKNLLDVAVDLAVRRFVHLSTTEVYGALNGEIDETCPHQYAGNPYGDSKIEAEKLCWEYCEKGLPVTIIRPPIVYGPYGRTWTIELAGKLQSGNWGVLEDFGEGICNLVYVSDLVSGILLAARHEDAIGEAFNLSGPEVITWNQYFRKFSAVLGLPELEMKAPHRARLRATLMEPIRSAARFALDHFERPIRKTGHRFRSARKLMQSLEKSIKTTPRVADLSLYSRDALYVTTKAQKMLGYEPKFGVDAGLDMTVRWLDHVGLVDQNA